jgi:predicted DNA-binding antitoxin AbrB/MazE fold protein
MDRVVEAIYENGVLTPLEALNLNEPQHVRTTHT